MLSRLPIPFVTTPHGRLDLPGLSDVIRAFPDAPFISISNNQRVALSEAEWLGTVYHGLPTNSLRPSFERGSYLAFLGRLTAVAIRIARATGMPLHIAAKVPRGERGYFHATLEPQFDGEAVRLIGEVDDKRKQGFLAGAAALNFSNRLAGAVFITPFALQRQYP